MTLKKLAVPFFVFSLAAVGCSSSTTTTGAGGSGGGAAGTGAAGTGAAGTGAAGTDAGAAGTGADAAAGVKGTDSGTDAISIDGSDALPLAECTSATMTSAPMSAADFCANLEAFCGSATSQGVTIPSDYSVSTCATTYAARTVAQRTCQSYHLCWGVEGKGNGPKAVDPHCSHAWGLSPCN